MLDVLKISNQKMMHLKRSEQKHSKRTNLGSFCLDLSDRKSPTVTLLCVSGYSGCVLRDHVELRMGRAAIELKPK